MIGCGTAEALGALVSSVAVKKDWVPAIWPPADPELAAVNANMANIDLMAEVVGPLAAGAALQYLGEARGFVTVTCTPALGNWIKKRKDAVAATPDDTSHAVESPAPAHASAALPEWAP